MGVRRMMMKNFFGLKQLLKEGMPSSECRLGGPIKRQSVECATFELVSFSPPSSFRPLYD